MVKVGLIGCGKWGINHARVYSELKCDLVGLSDPNPEVKQVAEKFGAAYYGDYRELLPKVDAVSVVVPTDLHYKVVRECIEAGKHVLVEKPMTLDSGQAEELLKLAKEKGVLLTVGYLFRFNSAVLELKRKLGDIGNVQYITARYVHTSKGPRKDCGVVFNFATHLIDILTFVLERTPKSVFCKSKNFISKDREDCAIITLDYGDFIAELEVSWLHPLKKRDMWLIGSKQKVYADFLEQMVEVHPIQVSENGVKAEKSFSLEIRKNEPLKEELKRFCEDVQNGGFKEFHDEHIITRICEACLESAKTGKEVMI